jgi:hypothetical protein
MIRRRAWAADRSVNAGWTCRVNSWCSLPYPRTLITASARASNSPRIARRRCGASRLRNRLRQPAPKDRSAGAVRIDRADAAVARRIFARAARAGAACVSVPRRLRSMSDQRAWRRGGLPASVLTPVRRRFDAPDQGDPDLPPHREPASLRVECGLRKERNRPLDEAKSHTRRPRCTLARMDQTSAGRNGGFGMTILPSFHSDGE